MATKIAEDLAEGDHIVWDITGAETQCTVVAVLVFPPNWGAMDQVVVRVTMPDDQPYFVNAHYGQQFEVPAW